MTNLNFPGYGAFFTQESKSKSHVERGIIGSDLETVERSLKLDKIDEEKSETEDEKYELDIKVDVAKGVWHFYINLKSFYELSFLCDIAPQLFPSNYFDSNLKEYAQKNLEVVKEVDGVNIYGIDGGELPKLSRRIDRWKEIDRGFSRLPSALLLSLVAAYDSAFSDFCKTLIKARPERYSGSDRKIDLSDILSCKTIDEVVDKIIDDELDQTMRKSHADQVDFFQKFFNVKLTDSHIRWDLYFEIFERRNLAAHGALIVNEIYLNKAKLFCDNNNIVIGQTLDVDTEYFTNAIDIMIEFGIVAALTAWRQQFPKQQKEAFSAVVEISYSLLLDSHPQVAENVLNYALSEKAKGANEEQKKMMAINLAIAHKNLDEKDEYVKLIESTDWSLCGPQFHLCRYSILEDHENAIKYIEPSMNGNHLDIQSIREWPAFQWIRKNDEFKKEVEKVALEPLFPSRMMTSVTNDSSVQSEAEISENDSGTKATRKRRPKTS